jgi:hypothetical protein
VLDGEKVLTGGELPNNDALLRARKPWVPRRRLDTELATSGITLISKAENYRPLKPQNSEPTPANTVKIYNKLPGNNQITNKKNLYHNMKAYYGLTGEDVGKYLPLTFLIRRGVDDPSFHAFSRAYDATPDAPGVWICKPGENSNRGAGIQCKRQLADIRAFVKENVTRTRS